MPAPTLTFQKAVRLGVLADALRAALPDIADRLRVEGASRGRRYKDPARPGEYLTEPPEPDDTLHVSLHQEAPTPPPVPVLPAEPRLPDPPTAPRLADFQTQAQYQAATDRFTEQMAVYQQAVQAQPAKWAAYQQALQAYRDAQAAYPALVAAYEDALAELDDEAGAFLAREAEIQAVIDAHDPGAPTAGEQLRNQVRTLAQSAVGVALNDLTTAQRAALLAVLLHQAGGLAPDLTVRPLAQWAR